jgi:hypothetical protein
MPRLSIPADTLNPYIDRITVSTGYELCTRCGQPILNGERAYVMWRSNEYGAFAHDHKCSPSKPRNWTKILKYEQANETLTWSSQRLPGHVTTLNARAALATEPAQTRQYEWERVTLSPGKLRKNRYQWKWTAGDPNWVRFDRDTGRTEIDRCGGSTVVIAGREFPFVSLLDWSHIRNAADIVDVELSKEYPAQYPGLGDTHDGIPSDEKVRLQTAVESGHGDDELGTQGLKAVVKRIVCTNREEQKMLDRLNLRPHHYVVETMKRRLPSHRAENARMEAQLYSVPTPELVRVSFPVLKISREKLVEHFLGMLVIREERMRSYGTGRKVVLSPDFMYWDGSDQRGLFPPDLTSKVGCLRRPKSNVTGNGPGEGQTWDVFGNVLERALYSDYTPRVFENGQWRRLAHNEYLEWISRPIQATSDVPSFKLAPHEWVRLMFPKDDSDLQALVNFWFARGNSALGSWTPTYERPWDWTGRENAVFASQDDRGRGISTPLAAEMASSLVLLGGGVTAPFLSPLSVQMHDAT